MREKYDCSAQIPDGLAPGVLDRNGLCVWDAYGPNRTRSMEEVGNELFDGNYEAALRQAFFDVIRSYPKQAFETFLYFKPKYIIKVIFNTLRPQSWGAAHAIELLTVLQIAVFVVFIGVGPAVAPSKVAARQLGVLALLIVPALAPQLLTFTAAPTAIDMLTYTLSGCAIVFWLVVSCAIQLMRRWPSNA
jgi:hypothetical protein